MLIHVPYNEIIFARSNFRTGQSSNNFHGRAHTQSLPFNHAYLIFAQFLYYWTPHSQNLKRLTCSFTVYKPKNITVGGIKTVTFPFRTVPSKWNTSVPFAVQVPFRVRKLSINMLGVSYQRGRNQS